jgi:hypothetical protein
VTRRTSACHASIHRLPPRRAARQRLFRPAAYGLAPPPCSGWARLAAVDAREVAPDARARARRRVALCRVQRDDHRRERRRRRRRLGGRAPPTPPVVAEQVAQWRAAAALRPRSAAMVCARSPAEACDQDDLGDATCADFGMSGQLGCTPTCQLDPTRLRRLWQRLPRSGRGVRRRAQRGGLRRGGPTPTGSLTSSRTWASSRTPSSMGSRAHPAAPARASSISPPAPTASTARSPRRRPVSSPASARETPPTSAA